RRHRQAARDHHRRRDRHRYHDPQRGSHPARARRQRDLCRLHSRGSVRERRPEARRERHREADHHRHRTLATVGPRHREVRGPDRGAALRRSHPSDPRRRVRRRALQPAWVAASAGHLAIATRSPVSFIGGLFDSNEGELRKLRKIATRVNQLEPELEKRSDEELAQSTARFRERLAKGETLDDILPEVFASVREAYEADITYGQNSEFGFDYLRDNMAMDLNDQVQRRGLHYAIVDEADSILIDEARTPLIISSPAEDASETYYTFARVAAQLQP